MDIMRPTMVTAKNPKVSSDILEVWSQSSNERVQMGSGRKFKDNG